MFFEDEFIKRSFYKNVEFVRELNYKYSVFMVPKNNSDNISDPKEIYIGLHTLCSGCNSHHITVSNMESVIGLEHNLVHKYSHLRLLPATVPPQEAEEIYIALCDFFNVPTKSRIGTFCDNCGGDQNINENNLCWACEHGV